MRLEVMRCAHLTEDPDEVTAAVEVGGGSYLVLSDFGGAGEIWIMVGEAKDTVAISAHPKRKKGKLFVQPTGEANQVQIGIKD